MKITRLRTKIEAILAVSFLILISVSSVYSVTRTISGTQDTVDTYIRNSNGKYWAATGANIQVALDDLGDENEGTVWLPGNTTITTTGTITIPQCVILDMQGCMIKPDAAGYDIIHMKKQSVIKNGRINCNAINMDNDTAMIMFNGTEHYDYLGTTVENMFLESYDWENFVTGPQYGTGIYFYNNHDFGTSFAMWVVCRDVVIKGCKYGIRINNTGGNYSAGETAFMNGNVFDNIFMGGSVHGIYIESGDTSDTEKANCTDGNFFTNIMMQPHHYSRSCLYAEQADYNRFEIMHFDWNGSGKQWENNSCAINLTSLTDRNYVVCNGASDDLTFLNDTGSKNTIMNYYESKFNVDDLRPTEGSDALLINKNINKAVYFFSGTGNPSGSVVRIYNNNETDRYLIFSVEHGAVKRARISTSADTKLSIESYDNMEISCWDSYIQIYAPNDQIILNAQDWVKIDDVLLLEGRTTDPPSLSDGMIWYNTTADLFYCRAGGATYTFNLTAV